MDWGEWFYYDESSPSCLRWKVDRWSGQYYKTLTVAKNSVAGTLHPSGYYYVSRKAKSYPVHKIIMEILTESSIPTGKVIDHIDGNSLNNRIENLRVINNNLNSRNLSKNRENKSGHTGVFYDEKVKGHFYWTAYWCDLDGKRKSKAYSVEKYGHEESFNMACTYRKKMIDNLNSQGAGYTERHGT